MDACNVTAAARHALTLDIAASSFSFAAVERASRGLLTAPNRGGLLHVNASGSFILSRHPPPHSHVKRCIDGLRWFRLKVAAGSNTVTVPVSMEAAATVTAIPETLPFLTYARHSQGRSPLVPRYYITSRFLGGGAPKFNPSKWRSKVDAVIFRGSPTNAIRVDLCRASAAGQLPQQVDVGLTSCLPDQNKWCGPCNGKGENPPYGQGMPAWCDFAVMAKCRRKKMNREQQLGYKYLLIAEGIAGADRLFELLGLGSLLIILEPYSVVEFWQAGRTFQPYVHYIPSTIRDLPRVMRWLRANQATSERIVLNANKLARSLSAVCVRGVMTHAMQQIAWQQKQEIGGQADSQLVRHTSLEQWQAVLSPLVGGRLKLWTIFSRGSYSHARVPPT